MEGSELGDRSPELEECFPKLKNGGYRLTSPQDAKYNCIAWAAGNTQRIWEYPPRPSNIYYWPPGVDADDTIESWQRVFEIHGYRVCESAELEPNTDKVAIYGTDEEPTHVAKQLESGAWTSKLSRGYDIEHETLELLMGDEADEYGSVVKIMKRTRQRKESSATNPS